MQVCFGVLQVKYNSETGKPEVERILTSNGDYDELQRNILRESVEMNNIPTADLPVSDRARVATVGSTWTIGVFGQANVALASGKGRLYYKIKWSAHKLKWMAIMERQKLTLATK